MMPSVMDAARASGAATPLEVARSRSDEERSLRTDLHEIAADFWRYRDLLYQMALRDVKIRYKQAIMGFGWAVFMPLLVVGAGVLVRVAMAQMSGTTLQTASIAGLAVKALPWSFFVGSIGFAVISLTGNMNLVSKIYFPREVLPISSTLAQVFDTSISAAFLALVLPFLGVRLSTGLLWLPVLFVLAVGFTAATCLLLACANLFFRDVKYIVQVLLTFGIFFTPVLYEPAMLGPVGAKLIMLNPLAPVLEGVRLAVVQGHDLLQPLVIVNKHGLAILAWSPWYLAYGAAWAVGGLFLASLLFHRLEFAFAEYV
jgi:ABC-type polysaccharide/polyol phosphate export permease